MTKKYLTPNKVADLLMVTPASVRQWAEKGELAALTTPGGHRRFLPEEVVRFARKRGMELEIIDNDKLRILIIDDDEQLTRYLSAFFEGYSDKVTIEIANDGFMGGLKVKKFAPQFILLDLMMPGIDGYKVCRRLKKDGETSDVRIIAMTGYPSQENVDKILGAGAERCIKKPINEQVLLGYLGLNDLASS